MATQQSFNKQVIALSSTATNISYTAKDPNVHSRVITINNTGKTAKTNYPFLVLFNHQDWHFNYKTGFHCNSFRVYDTDGVTRLEHYVEADNTTYCSLFIKATVAAGATKTITLEYGNNALPDLRNIVSVFGTVFNRRLIHLKANDCGRTWGGNIESLKNVYVWRDSINSQRRWYCDELTNTDNPVLVENQQNGQPYISLENRYFRSSIVDNAILTDATQHSIFVMCKNNTVAGAVSIVRRQNDNYQSRQAGNTSGEYLNIMWINAGVSVWANSHDGATSSTLATGITVANQTQLCSSTWQKNVSTTGWRTHRNGVLVAQRTSANNDIAKFTNNGITYVHTPNLTIGAMSSLANTTVSEKSNALIGDIVEFNEALNDTDRQSVELYFDTKYNYSASADRATLNLGAEGAATVSENSTEQFGIYKWNNQAKINERGVFSDVTTLEIERLLEKPLTGQSTLENSFWGSSSGSFTNNSKILATARAFEMTQDTTARSLDIALSTIIPTNTLTKYVIYNRYLNNTTGIDISEQDYIQFYIFIPDSSLINRTSSTVVLRNTANTLNYTFNLTQNKGTLMNGINILKFRINEATKTGAVTLSSVTTFTLNIIGTGSQLIQIANLKITADYARFANRDLRLQLKHTDDNYSTNFTQTQLIARQSAIKKVTDDVIEYTAQSRLDKFMSSKFEDLAGFKGVSILYSYNTYNPVITKTLWNDEFYFRMISNILLLNFGLNEINIDGAVVNTAEYSTNAVYNKDYYGFNSWNTVGEVLGALLSACGAIIYYDQITNKYAVTAITNYLSKPPVDSTGALVLRLDNIISVSRNDNTTKESIATTAKINLIDGVLAQIPPAPVITKEINITAIPQIQTSIRPTSVINQVDDLDIFRLSGAYNYRIFTDSYYLSDFGTKTDADDTVYTRGSMFPTDAKISGGKLFLSLANWGVSRFLHSLEVKMTSLFYGDVNNINGKYINQNVKLGTGTEYEILPNVASLSVTTTFGSESINFTPINTQILNKNKLSNVYSVNIPYNPFARLGGRVNLTDNIGNQVIGYVIAIDTYSDKVEQNLTIVQIN